MMNDKEIVSLLQSVQVQYEEMKKAEDDFPPKKEKKEVKPDPEKKDEEGPAAEDAEPKAPAKKAAPEVVEETEVVGDEVEGAAEEVGAEIAAEVPDKERAQLCAEYLGMDDKTLISHYVALNHALAMKLQDESPEEEAKEITEDPMMKRWNLKMEKRNAKKTGKTMMKSEDSAKDVSGQDKMQALEAQINLLQKSLDKLTSQPQNVAITGDNFMAKAEKPAETMLKKSDIIAKLCEKAKDPNLSAADRKKITAFNCYPVMTEELKKFLAI